MIITVLDFGRDAVDIITVSEEWLQTKLRNELQEWYDDEEWNGFQIDELIDLFLYEYCNYPQNNIQYIANSTTINYRTPKSYM